MSNTDGYNFEPSFERALVTLCATKSQFWGRVGDSLEVEALAAPEAKMVVQATRVIARSAGRGPDSTLPVLQQLLLWSEEGKYTRDQVSKVSLYFEDAFDTGLPGEEYVAAVVIPVLKRRLETSAVRTAMSEFASRNGLTKTVKLIEQASRVGMVDTSIGTTLAGANVAIERIRNLPRLSLGSLDIDSELNGGMLRGQLGVIAGGYGSGKSMLLAQIACRAAFDGLSVGLATLELPVPLVWARLKACWTGIPFDRITEDPEALVEADAILARTKLGSVAVQDFPPQVATVADIFDWVDRCADFFGRHLDVLVVDYGDKVAAPPSKTRAGDVGGYQTGLVVFEGLRTQAVARDFWVLTASQSKRAMKKSNGRRVRQDGDDLADSQHKARVTDLLLVINDFEDEAAEGGGEAGDAKALKVAKNRTGKGGHTIGPLYPEFYCGRFCSPSWNMP